VEHPIVQLRNVTHAYDGAPVLEDVSLTIPEGAFVGIVGPSGSGKTTLLRLIAGQLQAVTGTVETGVEGRPVRIGYVPQLEAVDWSFPVTVEEVVLMGMASSERLPRASRRARAATVELLDRLGIADLRRRQIRDLSGGQQQRAFLARALVGRPDLLLLDEPTSGVDIKTRHDILHLLHALNHEAIAVVLTTHDLNAVAAHLPRLVCLHRRVIAEGTPAEVLTPEVLRRLYGAEMVVIQREGMLLVGDVPSATRDPHDHHTEEEPMPTAHFEDRSWTG
jgi:zinc/manganese transport system ATP-binding protein